MNPELQKALLEIVQSAQKVGAVAWDQAPLVLRDLLVAGAIEYGLYVGVSLLGVVAFASLSRWGYRHPDHEASAPSFFCGFMAMVFSAGAVVNCTIHLLTIWLAPRAYLIGLMKEG